MSVYSSTCQKSNYERPNVIFILIDDLGWGDLGCYGNNFNETPNIDRLAAEGIRFNCAYASSTVCSPSRAGLLTGQTPPRNGITDYLRPETDWHLPLRPGLHGFADNELPADTDFCLDPNMITMAHMFRESGYATGIIGKWHLSGYDDNGVKFGPDKYGFDEAILSEQVNIGPGSYFWPYIHVDSAVQPALGQDEYLVDRMNHEAVEYIRRHADEPFFLYLSHYAVHTELLGKPEEVEYFSNKDGAGDGAWAPRNNPHLAAMLKSIDDGLGNIRKMLAESGLDRNTMIVFTSDNGGEAKITVNGHLRAGKSSTYEGGLRIPLIVSWPDGIPAKQVTDMATINLDFYPTFAELLGFEVPEAHVVDGSSILSLLNGREEPDVCKKRNLFWHYPLVSPHFLGGESSAATRDRMWKLIAFFQRRELELYNLDIDESETTNVAATNPEQVLRQRAILAAWLEEVSGSIPPGQALPAPEQNNCSGDKARQFFKSYYKALEQKHAEYFAQSRGHK